jgi:hypothetical protein
MIQVEVFWVVIPCSDVVGYQCFREPCFLQGPLKLWYPTTAHGVTTQKTMT